MKQVLVKKGSTVVDDIPIPNCNDDFVLIKVYNSCISAGTELSGIKATGKSMIKQVIENPKLIKSAINLLKEKGVKKLFSAATGSDDIGIQTGYSVSGVIIGVGKNVKKFQIGDEIGAAGTGFANHAEYVAVPENLVVKKPSKVSFAEASTVALGSIALHGVRRSNLKIGEFCAVIGAGILGLISLQILKSSGVRVAVIDLDKNRLKIAKDLGADLIIDGSNGNYIPEIINWGNGYGMDAVLFTASTNSNEALSNAFKMCRPKANVILVGISGMEIKREDIYKNEIDLLISTSYGPGRYDLNYEVKGYEYPIGYVRWTENRNMAEYLRMIDNRAINLDLLINLTFPIKDAENAFLTLQTQIPRPLIVLLEYEKLNPIYNNIIKPELRNKIYKKTIKDIYNIAVIGVGAFATGVHLPNLLKMTDKFNIYAIIDSDGFKAAQIAKQYHVEKVFTDYHEVLGDDKVDVILICTQHKIHSKIVLDGLKAGKNIFVEKPLAINSDELDSIIEFYNNYKNEENKNDFPLLYVGFNRRFSPYLQEISKFSSNRRDPLYIHYRINAGYMPLDHWVFDQGGRIIGEVCHIIDLIYFLTNAKIQDVSYQNITPSTEKYTHKDNIVLTLKFKDGSIGVIEYFSMGNSECSKEYMEIHFDNKSIILNNYQNMIGYGCNINPIMTEKEEKGHFEEWIYYYNSLKGLSDWPIPLEILIENTKITLNII